MLEATGEFEEKVEVTCIFLNANVHYCTCYIILSFVTLNFFMTIHRLILKKKKKDEKLLKNIWLQQHDFIPICIIYHGAAFLVLVAFSSRAGGVFLACWWRFPRVLVAFSSRARILGECLTIHSPPAFFFFFLKWRLGRTH